MKTVRIHGDTTSFRAVGILTISGFILWMCQVGWLAGRKGPPSPSPLPLPLPPVNNEDDGSEGSLEDSSWTGGSSPDVRVKAIFDRDAKRERDLQHLGMRVTQQQQQPPPPPSSSVRKLPEDFSRQPPVIDSTPLRRISVKSAQPYTPPKSISPRAEQIVQAMKHTWKGYRTHAFGHDELRPVSETSHDWVAGGIALTLVDSLDTLYLMGLDAEYEEAANFARTQLNITRDGFISVFETTIRVLGGLLSAYTLSHDKTLLDKAVEVADALYPAFFKTKTGIPYSLYNPVRGVVKYFPWTRDHAVLSEVGTLQLEWRLLSWLTNDAKYDEAATKAHDALTKKSKKGVKNGLLPLFVSSETGNFASSLYGVGGMGDSHYEYLFKQWIQGGNKTSQHQQSYAVYKKQWDDALKGVKKYLVGKDGKRVFVGQWGGGELRHKMDHLSCFLPGLLALNVMVEGTDGEKEANLGWGGRYTTRQLAEELMETCLDMYRTTPTGLAPEEVMLTDGSVIPISKFYLLRPETIESLFYMYRLTADEKYQDAGWDIFQAIQKYCRHPNGYTALESVTTHTPPRRDSLESFFPAETLKYLYLLFAPDDTLSLKDWVFNTEAHPFPIVERPGPAVTSRAWED